MSADQEKPKTVRVPVVGAEGAPSGYIDYLEWGLHPYSDGEIVSRRITMMLGRFATIPGERVIGPPPDESGEETVAPPRMEEKVLIEFVAEMSGDMLRQIRRDIDQILGDGPQGPPPEAGLLETVH